MGSPMRYVSRLQLSPCEKREQNAGRASSLPAILEFRAPGVPMFRDSLEFRGSFGNCPTAVLLGRPSRLVFTSSFLLLLLSFSLSLSLYLRSHATNYSVILAGNRSYSPSEQLIILLCAIRRFSRLIAATPNASLFRKSVREIEWNNNSQSKESIERSSGAATQEENSLSRRTLRVRN